MSKSTKEEKEKIQYRVTVLNRREIITYPKLGQQIPVMMITYVGANLAPRVIRIAKSEYSQEVERERIRADIEKRLREKPEAFEV